MKNISKGKQICIAIALLIAAIVFEVIWIEHMQVGCDWGAILCGVAFVLWIAMMLASEFYAVAKEKGYSDICYFWYAFLFGVVGYLLIIALPNKNANRIRVVGATEKDS